MNYKEKLLDPRWQKKRLDILSRDDFRCKFCGDNQKTLHVHHIDYKGKEPWEIEDKLLITLCDPCHNHETKDIKSSTVNLIKSLKSIGFTSYHFDYLSEAFQYTNLNFENRPHLFSSLLEEIEKINLLDKVETDYKNRMKNL